MRANTEVRESGLTKKALVLGVLGIFISACLYDSPGDIGSCFWPVRSGTFGTGEGLGDEGNHTFPALMGTFGMGMLLIFVAVFVNLGARRGWWKTRFTQQELAVMVIMAPLGGIMGASFWNPVTYWYSNAQRAYSTSPFRNTNWHLIPDMVFGPKGTFANATMYNAVWGWSWPASPMRETSLYFWQVPWDRIAPMIAISILFEAGIILCLVCSSMLLRYIWTRVEFVAFPYAEFYGSLVEIAQPSSSESSGSQKAKTFWWLLLIAFIVSFVYQFMGAGFERLVKVVTSFTIPGGYYPGKYRGYFPDPLNDWKASAYGWLGYDLVELAVLPFAGLYLVTGPWEIGWATFIPLNVLLSAVIGWLIMWVIFPLVYAPIAGWGTQPRAAFGIDELIDQYYAHSPDGFSITPLLIGMILAVLFVPLLIHRRESLTILKSIVKEPEPSFDPDRPIPYRLTWLLMIGGFLLTFLVGVGIMQIQPLPFLFYEAMLVILFTGVGKIISESGGWVGQMIESPHTRSYQGLVGAMTLSSFNVVVQGGTNTPTMSAVMTTWVMNPSIAPLNWGERVPWYSLYSIKLADSKKVKTKSVMIIVTLGFIAGIASLAIVTPAWQAFVTDFKRGNIHTALSTLQTGIIPNWERSLIYMDKTLQLIIIGFALVLALTLMQRSVALLRSLSIGGLITGLMLGYGLWLGWLITFIIKYLVLKVGGVKLFEEKWKPVALGLFCGGTVSNLIGQLFIVLGKTPIV